jgi:hypothetical protein
MKTKTQKVEAAEWAVQRAETALSDANESGDPTRIQKAETRLSNAMERLEKVA